MLSNRVAFALLAVACLGAAAGGGYLASRQNVAPAPIAALEAPVPASGPSATPVQETEALVGAPEVKPAEAPDPSPAASPRTAPAVKRNEPVAKPAAPASARAANPADPKKPEPLPTLERSWPSGSASSAPSAQSNGAQAPVPAPEATAPVQRPEERTAAIPEPARAPEPPQKTFEELVISADSVIGLQSETSLSSDRARVEDKVEARVTRDVRVRDMVAIPAGSRVLGTVVQIDRGGRFKERARLGIRFNSIVLADGTRMAISTDTIYREGDPPSKESSAKIGGAAVGGAILGAILGGGKGAAIGGAIGAGTGAAGVMASDRNAAVLRSGEPMTVRLLAPVTVTIEQK